MVGDSQRATLTERIKKKTNHYEGYIDSIEDPKLMEPVHVYSRGRNASLFLKCHPGRIVLL